MKYATWSGLQIQCFKSSCLILQGYGFKPKYDGDDLTYTVKNLRRSTKYKFRVRFFFMYLGLFLHQSSLRLTQKWRGPFLRKTKFDASFLKFP